MISRLRKFTANVMAEARYILLFDNFEGAVVARILQSDEPLTFSHSLSDPYL